MTRLIITADIHGNYNSWLSIKSLLGKTDSLVVAGDLFDTKYGNYSNPEFDPEAIKKDLNTFSHPFFYVYGNCDVSSFFPGFNAVLDFEINKKKIYMSHGHRKIPCNGKVDLVIQGHTHIAVLEKKNKQVFMNPGTITSPRNGRYTYGIMENKKPAVTLILENQKKLGVVPKDTKLTKRISEIPAWDSLSADEKKRLLEKAPLIVELFMTYIAMISSI